MLLIHIVTCTLSYICFGAAFALAVTYIRRARRLKRKEVRLDERFPFSLNRLDIAIYNALLAGSVLLAIGLPTGLIAMENESGVLDAASLRVTVPLVILAFYLYAVFFRCMRGMLGMKAARMAVVGFAGLTFSLVFEIALVHSLP